MMMTLLTIGSRIGKSNLQLMFNYVITVKLVRDCPSGPAYYNKLFFFLFPISFPLAGGCTGRKKERRDGGACVCVYVLMLHQCYHSPDGDAFLLK